MSESRHSSGNGALKLTSAGLAASPITKPVGAAIMQEETRKSSPEEAQSKLVLSEDENKVKPSAECLNTPRASDIPNGTIATGDDAYASSSRSDLLDRLYTSTVLDAKSKEAVWLKSSKPSTISLNLQVIQEAVKPPGHLDTDTLNMAIRKMVTEDKSFGSWKHCLSSDFALCIPVVHGSVGGHWSLYSFNMDDSKLYILDSLKDSYRHADVMSNICGALEFANEHLKLFSYSKIEFKSWVYIFAEVPQQNNSYDCGFFIFNFIRQWNGFGLSLSLHFPYDTMGMRKEFLSYILSSEDNEAKDQLPSNVSKLIKELSDLKNTWLENGTMDIRFLEAVRKGDVKGFQKLLDDAQELGQKNGRGEGGLEQGDEKIKAMDDISKKKAPAASSFYHQTVGIINSSPRYKLLRGATSDGDGVLHLAARYGHVNMIFALLCELGLLGVEDEKEVLGAASNNQNCKGEEVIRSPNTCIQYDRKARVSHDAGCSKMQDVPGTCNKTPDGESKAALAVSSSSQEEKEEACKQGTDKEVLLQEQDALSTSSSNNVSAAATCNNTPHKKEKQEEGVSEKEEVIPSTTCKAVVERESSSSSTLPPPQQQQHYQVDRLAAPILRSTNCKGETCLHDAVRVGHARLVWALLLADARLNDGNSPPLVQIRDGQGSSPLFMAKMAGRKDIVDIIQSDSSDYRYSPSEAGPPKTAASTAVDQLYEYTMSLEDAKLREAVWLSNSYPSLISLKLRTIQKTVKANGRMDADSLNFAIRKLGKKDCKPLVRKHYISTDLSRCAIYKQGGGHSSLETCIDDDFLDHHSAFEQDANPPYSHRHYNAEVLCIPVVHDGHWSLYAFNMNEEKLSILDPRRNCKCHKGIRLKICKALEFVKVKFNIFKNKSTEFSGWAYEVAECGLHGSKCTDDDSGFLVFNYMRYWDGHQLCDAKLISNKSTEMRKDFLAYILSFKDNEAYQLPSEASQLIKDLPAGPTWTRCEMDKDLLKALREGRLKEHDVGEKLIRGVACDGDGMLHIAVRLGKQQLLNDLEQMFFPSEGDKAKGEVLVVIPDIESSRKRTIQDIKLMMPVFAESLRARNNKGETCLHEAVRRGDKQSVHLLISMDEKLDGKTCNNTSPLVQIVDYQGVSPLYLATTLRSGDIIGFLTATERKYLASWAGPRGKTAMHAAVLLDKDAQKLTEQLLKWMRNDPDRIPDLIGMVDKSGNTPLHLLASVGGTSITELLLSPGTSMDEATTELSWVQRLSMMCSKLFCCCRQEHPANNKTTETKNSCTPREPSKKGSCADDDVSSTQVPSGLKDSNGWLPIHVAAANGRLDVIKKLLEAWPECMQSLNDSGQTFLHLAIEKKMQDVVDHVCSQQSLAGILNLRDRDGNTALHLAVKSGNRRMFCSLMSNKEVGFSFANKEGRTPLDLAKLSIQPGLQFLLNSRVMIHGHLKICGSDYGTYRRDDLLKDDEKEARKLDKDKLSETISKSAGLMAVCAIFMLNISVTAFFSVAKQYLPSTDPNAAAAPAPAPSLLPAAAARTRAFRALIVSDALTFASSSLAAFCSTFAGFSIMDRRVRFEYLRIAGFSLQIACLAVVAVFVLAAYLAFAPIDPHVATAAYVLPLVAVTPQLITPSFVLLLHTWALLSRSSQNARATISRSFQKHLAPRLHRASAAFRKKIQDSVYPKLEAISEKIPICLSVIINIMCCLAKCCWCILCALFSGPVIIVIVVLMVVGGIIAFLVYLFYP